MCPRIETFSVTRGRLARLTSSAIEYPSSHWLLLEQKNLKTEIAHLKTSWYWVSIVFQI